MTEAQIHTMFKHGYNQSSWKTFIGETFLNAHLFSTPDPIIDINNNVADKAFKLGYINLDENGVERQIAIYEVVLAKGIVLERNRVGLRNLLRKYWRDIDAAFIVYHNGDNSSKLSQRKWRFTYVSELTGYDSEGKFKVIQTEPKRYTYVLGEGESTRTAAQRFSIIADKGSKSTLDDIKKAFDVEKLSQSFFDEYKMHYNVFCDYMMQNTGIRAAIFNGDEKAISDFVKKMLGRIVFIYFIQKKGWMGVPAGSNWGEGDFNFLSKHFNNFQNKDLFYDEFLCPLFFETLNKKREDDLADYTKLGSGICRIPYLNGGLFDEENKNYRDIIFDGQLFQNLFKFFNQYNFTIYEDDPNDHTMAVDPEMLGHIFENLLEDNKDKGAFYTPKEIVHYMCQESLIEYLSTWFENKGYEVILNTSLGKETTPQLFPVNEGKKGQLEIEISNTEPGNKIDRLLIEKLLKKKLEDSDKKLIVKHADEFHTALDNVKICDPAIGSGAFPMGLLQEIFTAKETLWHFQHNDTKCFPASEIKLNIIQNSIYGVDIEKGAVDIARLRFWLSLVVDEDVPKSLPNLDYKIVVGNSLVSKLGEEVIDVDWNIKQSISKADVHIQNLKKALKLLSQKQKEFYESEDKNVLKLDIRNLKLDILIYQLSYNKEKFANENVIKTDLFSNLKPAEIKRNLEIELSLEGFDNTLQNLIELKDNPNKPLNFFDWRLDFPEVLNEQINPNPGFDIVIGNPPYVSAPTMVRSNPQLRAEIINSKRYKTLHQKWDLFIPFMELGLQLLTQNGAFSMIVPYPFTNQTYGLKIREHIIKQYNLKEIVDLNGTKIFEKATVSNCIPFISKSSPGNACYISNISDKSVISKVLCQNYSDLVQDEKTLVWNLTPEKRQASKHSEMNVLGDFCYISVGMVLNANEKTAKGEFKKDDLISETYDEIHCREYIDAKDIEKYRVKRIRYLEYNTNRSPDNLRRPTFRELYENPKLMFNRLGTLMVYLDESIMFLHSDSMYSGVLWKDLDGVENKSISSSLKRYYKHNRNKMVEFSNTVSLHYLLVVLNSKYISVLLTNFRAGDYHIYPEHIRNLPIPHITLKRQKPLIELAKNILKEKVNGKDTTILEQKADNLIYRLYGLSYDEVKSVDPEFQLSKMDYESIEIK